MRFRVKENGGWKIVNVYRETKRFIKIIYVKNYLTKYKLNIKFLFLFIL